MTFTAAQFTTVSENHLDSKTTSLAWPAMTATLEASEIEAWIFHDCFPYLLSEKLSETF